VNHQLEYGAIEGSSIPICIFSFNKFTNLGNKALGIGIGFKFHGTYGTVNITIGATMLGCTHLISSGDEAFGEHVSEHFLFLFIQEFTPSNL
jgi:hypothetical protein